MIASIAGLCATQAHGIVYYVSPTGSDSNSGTSPLAPWGSVNKVDSTSFNPGDQILFQYGSSWTASLDINSSGSTSAPIVFGAYGNPSMGNPVFNGSNPVSNSAFTTYSGTTFTTTSSTPINCVYINHSFLSEAQDYISANLPQQNSTDPATDLSIVENTPYTFYYNAGNGQLFVNAGTGLTTQKITLGVRQDAILALNQSNLIIRNLNTTETAVDQGGYGIRIENAANVSLLNSNVSLSGKHAVGLIDATNVNVTNVVANYSQPQLGFGGASAFVSFNDAAAGATSINGTSVYTNDSYINPNGNYASFISHGATNGIASLAINNGNSIAGSAIYTTGPNEVVIMNGGQFSGGTELDTNNSVINGVTFQGPYGAVVLNGATNTVVQNSIFISPSTSYGGFLDNGINTTFRFNVVNGAVNGPSVTEGSLGYANNVPVPSNTTAYGNVIANTVGSSGTEGLGMSDYSNGPLSSNFNVYFAGVEFQENAPTQNLTASQWQALGYDLNSLFTGATFNNSSGGDYSLAPGSAGIGLVPMSEVSSSTPLANSLLGSTSSNGNYSAGLNPYISTTLSNIANTILVSNTMAMTVIAPTGNLLTLQSAGSITVFSTASLDLACNVNNAGNFVSTGSFIQTGNFNNSGSFYISGSQLWSPGTVFTNLSGNAVFATDAGGTIAPVGYLSINASGGSVMLASSQHLAGLTVLTGATVQVSQQSIGSPSIVYTPSLTVTGTLDLTNNDLIVQGGDLAAVTALVKLGLNNGKWTGTGITSSTAAADSAHLTGIGVILNTADGLDPLYAMPGISGATLGLFDGASPNPNDVLVKYTYYGDANLSGHVDGTDYSLIDNGYAQHLTGWFNGDFNYDGIINGSDYTLIDNAFNQQGASLATAVSTAQIAANTAVPEPAIALTAIAAIGFISRRRRRC